MDNSSSSWVVIGIVVGLIGTVLLIIHLFVDAAHSHPLICWKISPMYAPDQCILETTQFDK
jgi:hypothetical protein